MNKDTRKTMGKLNPFELVLLVLLPVLVSFLCLSVGRMRIAPADVFTALKNFFLKETPENKLAYAAVISVRLPRIVLALLTGAGLSLSGCAFQSLFANPLATPDTVSVSSGAAFGAALGILLGFSLPLVHFTAFLFGILAVALTWITGSGKGKELHSVVLSGIMIGALFSALVSLIKFVADSETKLPAITYFLMGSLQQAGFKTILFGAVPILSGCILFMLIRFRMNLLPLSEDEIRAFGVNVKVLRGVTVVTATLVTASCVAMCGQVGWIGLLVPHMCRMRYKNNHLTLVPACIFTGAAFMVVVDTLARSLSQAEIPVSVLTAIIGAPFFIWLMRRSGGWKL